MNVEFHKNTSVEKTINAMKQMRDKFYTDVAPFAFMDLEEFFDLVKNLPYQMEEKAWHAQILQRPAFTLARLVPVVACANKAILLGSFLTLQGIENGFVVSANTPIGPFGHVFNWCRMFGTKPRILDATYPENIPFREKRYPQRRIFP